MRLTRFNIISNYLGRWNGLVKSLGFIVTAVGFIAAAHSLYVSFISGPSDGEKLRLAAAKCRTQGYSSLKMDKEIDAAISFRCAEQKFKEAIALDDDLSLWGLSNLYSDELVQPLLPAWESKDYKKEAVMYWCEARFASVPEAAGKPPFIDNPNC